jgi:hypothetical protein
VEGQIGRDGTKQRFASPGIQHCILSPQAPYYLRLIRDRYGGNGGIDKYGDIIEKSLSIGASEFHLKANGYLYVNGLRRITYGPG